MRLLKGVESNKPPNKVLQMPMQNRAHSISALLNIGASA
jgi:hypothetical protein